MSQKNVSVKKINIIVTVIFVVILAVSTALQISNNKKSAIMASDMVTGLYTWRKWRWYCP